MKPIVAIVGRPNVGKSTLFNRVTKRKDALVDNIPGVTRDRHYRDAKWDGKEFTLIDTGGFWDNDSDGFSAEIRFQVKQAIEEADSIIFLMDGKNGVSPFDREIISLVRDYPVKVYYVVNKIDGPLKEENIYDFYSLGIDNIHSISAEHGYGVADFLDELIAGLPITEPEPLRDITRISVVGRPNVGKSSLINRIVGEKRLLVSDIPGTTRDSIDSLVEVNGKVYCFVDTAGIRRKSKVSRKLEKFSVIKALKSLERCDVALIVLDAFEGITEQDVRIAGYAYERGCGTIFLLNKWDLAKKDGGRVKAYYEQLKMEAKFLAFAPALSISALTGLRVRKVFQMVDTVYRQYSFRIGTGPLNRIIERAIERTEPSLVKGKRLKFYYASQVSSKPPCFVLFVNYPQAVHFSYKRFLKNQIREHTGLDQTPIRLIFRPRSGRKEINFKKQNQEKRKHKK